MKSLLLNSLALASLVGMSGLNAQELAKSLMQQGHYDQAISQYQSQLDYNPFDAVAANNLAVAYAMKRDYPAAKEWMEKAARMDRSRHDIALNLETLQRWLKKPGAGSSDTPLPAAISGPLSPEPPTPW